MPLLPVAALLLCCFVLVRALARMRARGEAWPGWPGAPAGVVAGGQARVLIDPPASGMLPVGLAGLVLGGLALGMLRHLALVKRIVEVHGGRVRIVSEGDGSGTTVCFTLPTAPGG